MFKRRAFLHWFVHSHWFTSSSLINYLRYTEEGMDVMEFAEAESNTYDLMWVFLPAWLFLNPWSYFSAEYQQVITHADYIVIQVLIIFLVPRGNRWWRSWIWSRGGNCRGRIIKYAWIVHLFCFCDLINNLRDLAFISHCYYITCPLPNTLFCLHWICKHGSEHHYLPWHPTNNL